MQFQCCPIVFKLMQHLFLSVSYLSYAETEAWFIDSLEAWRKAKNLNSFILLGHSFGGYVAAKYALKVKKAFIFQLGTC